MRTTLKRRLTGGLFAALLCLPMLPAMSAEVEAELLVYRVQPRGEAAYLNRLLATPAFLRLDRGAQDSGFILYDRKQQVIYSVDHDAGSILVIDPPAADEGIAAQSPEISLQPVEPADAPPVAGVKPQHWALSVAGESCRQAFVLPGQMRGAVTAYAEYLRLLSRQQAQALSAIPAEFQDACDNAVHVFAADALLHKGLPVNLWDGRGHRERLLDFQTHYPVPASDFTLPADYARMPMGEMR